MNSDNRLCIRFGCELEYEAPRPVLAIFLLRARLGQEIALDQERVETRPELYPFWIFDTHGNRIDRIALPPGISRVRYDALARVPSQPETLFPEGGPPDVANLPPEVLRYARPSRYCDSERVRAFAAQQFGQCAPGLPTVRAICDWVHQNIEYRYGAGDPETSASETLANCYGVGRDFAHLAIALCRSFNLPARYTTGYLPDIGRDDSGDPMDFHAYMEVYLGDRWHAFDPHFNVPRIGRIPIAAAMDAVDGAFATTFGDARLTSFDVWSYQVQRSQYRIDVPVDLRQRLCGTAKVRFA